MVDGYQKAALETRLGIPMIYGIDAVHCKNNVYGTTIFPHNIGLGATRDADLAYRIGVVTALEVRASGIPYDFTPCVAVSGSSFKCETPLNYHFAFNLFQFCYTRRTDYSNNQIS